MTRRNSLPPYLEHRKSGYLWRRRAPRTPFPEDSRKNFVKLFFSMSTRTHVLRDAEVIAQRLTAISDVIFAAYSEKTMTIAADIAEKMLIELARLEIEAFERTRSLADPLTPDVARLELDRELALQDTLRRAIYLGDRSIAEKPLLAVAERLDIELQVDDPDFKALAYEATKTLLDVSTEREKRRLGCYEEPTLYFRHATRPTSISQHSYPASALHASRLIPSMSSEHIALAGFAATSNTSAPTHAPATVSTTGRPRPEKQERATRQPTKACVFEAPDVPEEQETDAIMPVNFTLPDDMTPLQAQAARVSVRPPMLHFNRDLLSPEIRIALEKPRGITTRQAMQLYIELKELGYGDDFSQPQARDRAAGEKWRKENKSKNQFSISYWSEHFGDTPIDEIGPETVDDAIEMLWRVPRDHNRGEIYHTRDGYADLIERCDAEDAAVDRKVAAAEREGVCSATIDEMRKSGMVARFRVDTFLKHGRRLGAVGKMLWQMQLIDQNPFAVCVWPNKTVKTLRKREEGHARVAWDDRIYELLGTWPFKDWTCHAFVPPQVLV